MKRIKVSEATELQLDWLVAKCEGQVHEDRLLNGTTMYGWWISGLFVDSNNWIRLNEFKPSSNWAQGGPIVERECIFIAPTWNGETSGSSARASRTAWIEGPTPLIAAMRCYATSKLGDTVEVPEELT